MSQLLPRFRDETTIKPGKCATGKIRYEQESDALAALVRVRKDRLRNGDPTPENHAYYCARCDGYHLSSRTNAAHGDDFKPVWRNQEETWEQYARRLEKRIKEQRTQIMSLHTVGHGGTNRETRKKIAQLTIALGRMTERWEAERSMRMELVRKLNRRSWWSRIRSEDCA